MAGHPLAGPKGETTDRSKDAPAVDWLCVSTEMAKQPGRAGRCAKVQDECQAELRRIVEERLLATLDGGIREFQQRSVRESAPRRCVKPCTPAVESTVAWPTAPAFPHRLHGLPPPST